MIILVLLSTEHLYITIIVNYIQYISAIYYYSSSRERNRLYKAFLDLILIFVFLYTTYTIISLNNEIHN